MQQLSELDSSFLYLENERTPLHTGGVFVFKKRDKDSAFNFNRFRDLLSTKLANEPFFRERLVEKPLSLDLPYWADDPNFELDNHLKHTTLKEHSGKTLMKLASELFSEPLDLSRPLWSATYIDELTKEEKYSNQHFALVLKVHITAIDGSTGEDILSQLLHVSPEIEQLSPPQRWIPEALPSSDNWLSIAYNNARTIPTKLAGIAKDTASSAFYSLLYERLQKLNLPSSLMSVASTPINLKVSGQRIIDNHTIPLHRIRKIRAQLNEVTTNDILMGICAEALSQCIKQGGGISKIPLIALAPISVRSTSLDVKSGNQLAATLFSMATTETDPIKRIHLIHDDARSSNSYDEAISADRLTELVPSCITSLSARVYSEFLLAQKHKPMFNLPITNVPGPQFPLYLEDNELTQYICASTLFDGIGLGIVIVSYNGVYSITTTHCPELLHSNQVFSEYLEKALNDIETALENNGDAPYSSSHTDTRTGFIKDTVGLVSNLFSFSGKTN